MNLKQIMDACKTLIIIRLMMKAPLSDVLKARFNILPILVIRADILKKQVLPIIKINRTWYKKQ